MVAIPPFIAEATKFFPGQEVIVEAINPETLLIRKPREGEGVWKRERRLRRKLTD